MFFANNLRLQTTMFYSQNPEKHYTMSKLLVFGPSSFPLLTTKSGAVVMAGGYYGAGRVVVLPHELLLSNTALMVGSALWVSGRVLHCGGRGQFRGVASLVLYGIKAPII